MQQASLATPIEVAGLAPVSRLVLPDASAQKLLERVLLAKCLAMNLKRFAGTSLKIRSCNWTICVLAYGRYSGGIRQSLRSTSNTHIYTPLHGRQAETLNLQQF